MKSSAEIGREMYQLAEAIFRFVEASRATVCEKR